MIGFRQYGYNDVMNMSIADQNNKHDLREFAERLLVEKNLSNVDDEIKEQMKKDLVERLEDRINVIILERMPPEKLEEFEVVVDEADSEEINRFCVANIPDLDQIVAAELISFRTTYLANG